MNAQKLACRKRQRQLGQVQRHSTQSILLSKQPVNIAFSIAHIAHDRMTQVFKVSAYLVQSPGSRECLDEGPTTAVR